MWYTPEGMRILEGAEAQISREVIGDLIEWIGDEADGGDQFEYGVKLFDELSWQQRLALINEVGRALLLKGVSAPLQTAMREAAIATIYANLKIFVEEELDHASDPHATGPRFYWRRLIRRAVRELGDDERPALHCDELWEWQLEIDCLSEAVLWDADWEMADEHLDYPPDAAVLVRTVLTIDDYYFVIPAPDPPEREMPRVWRSVRRLCR